jgi:hypothetical protein
LRRFEDEEAQATAALATVRDVEQLAKRQEDVKARSRRVLLRLRHAANRSKWISSTECALYAHTEQQHWTSHNEVSMILSRPLYQIFECKRILSGSKKLLTRAAASTNFSVLDFKSSTTAGDAQQLASTRQEMDAPRGLRNAGNTCFMNA